jgi:hypothetical protein
MTSQYQPQSNPPQPPYPPQYQRPDPNAKSGFATAGFVCALVGLFIGFIVWPLPVLGVVFGAIGWRHKLGKAAVIIGAVSIVLGVILFASIFAGGNSTTNSLHRTPPAVQQVAPNALTAPAPGSPIGSYDTNELTLYLTGLDDQSSLVGGPYTDTQLTTYGEEACTDGAYTDELGAAMQLALDEGIPNYDAGYITGAAAVFLCTS